MLGVVNVADLLGISSLLVISESVKGDAFTATEHLYHLIWEARECIGRPRRGI